FPHRDMSQPSPRTRASQARFVPPSTFRTSSTASSSVGLAGLFHPAATYRVRSSGVSPRAQPHGLVARRCPLAVGALSLRAVSRPLQVTRSPPGPFSARESVADADGLDPRPLDPLLSFASLGFFFAHRDADLHRHLRPRPFSALVVCTVRDLPCSFEPCFPVRSSRPDPRLRLAPALVSRPLLPGDPLRSPNSQTLLRAPYQLVSVDKCAISFAARAPTSVFFLVTVVNKLRARCVAV